MDQNMLLLEPRHLGVLSGASKMISLHMVHLAQIVHLSCVKNDFRAYGTFAANSAPILHH
jgi:hypothetical protein